MRVEKKSRSRGQARAAGKNAAKRSTDIVAQNRAGTIPIHAGRKVVGYVAAGVFCKTIRGSLHMLRTPRAIAFDVSSLQDAEAAGARYVEVTDSETGKLYRAAMSTIWAKGWAFNRGHGDQWGCVITEWNKDDRPAQLSLFRGTA